MIGLHGARLQLTFDETSPLHTININNLVINNSSSTGVSVDNNYGLIVQGNLTLTNGDLRLVGESQLVQVLVVQVHCCAIDKLVLICMVTTIFHRQ